MIRPLDAQDPAGTYAAVLDALPIVAWVADPGGTVTYVSRGWERFTGNSGDDVFKRNYEFLVFPDDLAGVVAAWDAARATGNTYRDEFRIRHGDASYRWVLSQGDPMRDPGGTIVGWFSTLTDIHALRLAEERMARALETSEANRREAAARAHFVERLMDASDDCIKVLDLNARLLSMSANGQKSLAIMDFKTVEGADWLTFWFGADRVAAEAAVETARAGGRGRFMGLFRVEGRDRWWDVTVTPILDAHDRPEQLLAVSRDVTERVLSNREMTRNEERYRVLGEALPGVTWTATPDGSLDYIGGSAMSVRAPGESRVGDAWLDVVHPDDRARAAAAWAACVENGEPYEIHFRVKMAGGAFRWQLARAMPQRDETGSIVRWVGVNVDVDDQHRADEAREQFVRLAEASDDFISIGDEHGNTTYLNAAGRKLLAIGGLRDAPAMQLMNYFTDEDRPYVISEILPALKRDGRWAGEFRLRDFATGEPIPIWYNVFSLFDDTGRTTGMAAVARDLRDRYRVDAGLRALAEAGAAMYGSLDFDGTVQNVADAVARSFASFCTVDTVGADGEIHSVVSKHTDPAIVPLLEELAAARNDNPDDPVARAIDRGESTLVAAFPRDRPTAGARTEAGERIDALDLRSMLYVPIRSAQDGRIFGALSCYLSGHNARGNYTSEDLRFAEEIAVRAALAFDHARAYERERRIAVTLQEASLPKGLPEIHGLRLSADYRPGNSEATIGGDWYDAF
ncbi:MAG: PAS domain-containing protein, partial [Candidatus Eremiobacteraeota bacterium]|nr:PAS domain-containing protein [Candidatus Eremiobacteraeota bacterium]